MKRLVLALLLSSSLPIFGQTGSTPGPDPWKAVNFLEGTWDAKTPSSTGISTSGRYTFQRELGDHIMARHSSSDPGCKAPASFDCQHGDLMYIFQDAPGQPLRAIYFDSEGHVIHYGVTTPDPTTVIFLSEPSPGPQFRLIYERTANVMTGKFQMHMPGPGEWRSYLEWSGSRQ